LKHPIEESKMPIEILMPAVAPSMTEGAVAQWLKKVGEPVKVGEPLLEIETDKAIVAYESPQAGVLGKILVPDGTANVKVDQLIALLLAEGEDASQLTAPAKTPAALSTAATQPAAAQAAPATSKPSSVAMPAAVLAQAARAGGRIPASPLARKLALEKNLDLSQIAGSGPNGRIVRLDVEAAVSQPRALAVATTAPLRTSLPAPVITGDYEVIPHSNMRRIIAQRLSEAKQVIPHYYVTMDCEIDALLDARHELNRWSDASKISVNDFVIKAVAVGLKKMPGINASWTDDAMLRYRNVDISVAVSTPTGLITPIVRNADTKGLAQISNEMRELAERGREGRLAPSEYQGGGFSISNLGMYGVREFTAIINPPQSCILAVGAGEQRAVVKDGALGVATVMSCTLSVDHRVIDGAQAAEFMALFKKLIEHPLSMVM
jgi:pyruvate dehydrogenase E2 component (dihydrolipoamide acetyltransferase)